METIEDTLGESAETAAPGAGSPTPRADATRGIVPGLLGEGLTMLAGGAKTGKPWLALDLAVAVARGAGRRKLAPFLAPRSGGEMPTLSRELVERSKGRR